MQQKREVKILLADSFKELVLEKAVEKITIKEITDRAGVIRVTFYNHFQDKYELLEWICREEVVSPTVMLFENNMQREAVLFMFTAILKNRQFYRHVAHTSGQNSFESILQQLISEVVEHYFESRTDGGKKNRSRLNAKWVADYYSRNLTFILMSWIEKDMETTPEEMVELYAFLSEHSMISLPEKY